jgi:hypothetical protein
MCSSWTRAAHLHFDGVDDLLTLQLVLERHHRVRRVRLEERAALAVEGLRVLRLSCARETRRRCDQRQTRRRRDQRQRPGALRAAHAPAAARWRRAIAFATAFATARARGGARTSRHRTRKRVVVIHLRDRLLPLALRVRWHCGTHAQREWTPSLREGGWSSWVGWAAAYGRLPS